MKSAIDSSQACESANFWTSSSVNTPSDFSTWTMSRAWTNAAAMLPLASVRESS